MNQSESPYIVHCAFCGNGLLRFMRCDACQSIVAVCDECELIWQNVAEVSANPTATSSSSFPTCPRCGIQTSSWSKLGLAEIEEAALGDFVAGRSV